MYIAASQFRLIRYQKGLDANGNYLFDLDKRSNITIPANGTYTYSASGYTNSGYLSNPGSYKAVARGRVPGGNWWDWQTTGSGVNPRNFQVVIPDPEVPTLQSPSNWQELSSGNVNFNWTDAANAVKYRIKFKTCGHE